MKWLSLVFILGLVCSSQSSAQGPNRLIFVLADPTGACNDGQAMQWNATSGNLSGCKASVWSVVASGGSGGPGTVTSVTLAGTANQITATGTCTGTTVITCTLSIPSAFQLPGTIDGLTITTTTGTFTLTNAKTLTVSNTMTFTAVDSSSIAFGSGGTVLYSGGALGTPSSGNASNLTNFPTLNQNTSGTAANLSGTPALPNGTTATTQSQGDNSTKLSTTAYTDLAVANAIAGINPAVAVQAATTSAADTSGFTYNNGVSGVGATFTGTTNTAITIDGFTFTTLGQRLLVKNDTQSPSGAFNGVYYVTQLQTSLLAPILTRALDYDTPSDMNNTGSIPVINGTVNGSTSWLMTAQVVTVGTTPLTFVIFSYAPSTVVQTTRNINTTSPLGGGGPLSSDLTLTCTTCSTGGSGALTQISQQILGSPASSVTFSSIPGTYTNLILVMTAACSAAAVTEGVNVQFNGDSTGTHYQSAYILGGGGGNPTGAAIANSTFLGNVACASAVAGASSSITALISSYSQTTFTKMVRGIGIVQAGTTFSAGNLDILETVIDWSGTAAITSMVLNPGSGNFITGSSFTLYGEQ